MVYIFDPTTCEEPKKPTYKYSPIPKAVECSSCPNLADYEEGNGTEGANPEVTPTEDKFSVYIPNRDESPEGHNDPLTFYVGIGYINNKAIQNGYVIDKNGVRHELILKDGKGYVKTDFIGQFDFETFDLYRYTDTGEHFVAKLALEQYLQN